ncbi:MAG TPA: ABC transporter permease [Bryobacteraceae bacterium]|jgi:predicted permease|nr:ABC transporter permease [Bryobacteraceae bacterium]
MWRWKRYFSKFRNLFRHGRAERELSREVASHLALLEDDFQRRGMTPVEARLAARRAYGGIEQVKELQRDERSFVWVEQMLRDLRYAWRNLARNPGFTLVVVLTLTLGIGVNATLFSAYNAVALKPLPVADPNEVVRLERWFERSRGDLQYAFSYPEYAYCRDHNDVFSNMVAATPPHQMLAETAGGTHALQSEMAAAQLVSANYFSDLGIGSQLGRTFLPEEDRTPGANTVTVISYPFWQHRFHGDPRVLGKIVKINGIGFTILGVAPESFTGTSTFPQVLDLWVPLSMQAALLPGPDWLHEPDSQQFQILARLKASTTPKRAQAETDSLIRQFATTFKPHERTISTTLQRTAFFGNTDDSRFKEFIAALMLIVGSVLLVACANVANMLLARGAARHKEIGVRLALGASRGRIIRQLLSESILLALLGGIGGLLASIWTTKLLWISIEQVFAGTLAGNEVFKLDVSPDGRVLGYALVVSLLTGILFGLSPALEFSRPDITRALKDEGASLGRRWSRSRTRGFLVAMQVGVSMVLLICTGLLLRGLVRSQAADPGFETHEAVLLSGDFGSDLAKSVALERRLMDRLQTVPGVETAALGTVPLLGTWTPPIVIEDGHASQNKSGDRTLASYASDTYFKTLGVALLRGRGFTEREAANNAHVAVISESTARHFWPGEDPLGKRFKLDLYFRQQFTEFEVVGIAKDVRFTNLTRIDPTHVYVPTGAKDFYPILLRSQGDTQSAIASVRVAVEQLDKNLLPSLWLRSIEKGPLHLQRSMAQTYAMYAGFLALLALTLAGVGIYGVMAYLVNQRVAEIGIRMALGATATNVLKVIVVEGLRPTFIGIAVGMTGAAALAWVLHTSLAFPGAADFFYGVPFYDPATFLGLAAFFTLVAAIATFVPARRALGVDPMIALRYE